MADDLNILLPDRTITLKNGTVLTVKEIRFGEQLRLANSLNAVSAALKPALTATHDAVTAILDALSTVPDHLITLIALSIEKPVDFVKALSGEDGEMLSLTWWGVNQGFFVRRLIRPLMLKAADNHPSNGDMSLPASSEQGTTNQT